MQNSLEFLEPRRLLAAVFPTANEQYEVELINRARANPAAEAARLGIALNEGLPANTISTTAKQPLAISRYITDAARKHSQWMIDNDVFQHEGPGNNSPQQRISNSGFIFIAPSASGENIGYRGTKPSVPDQFAMAGQLHSDLFIDKDIAGRGHRTNMMNASFKEIGAGIVSGVFQTFNSVMLTTDFGFTGTTSFITGVAYNDTTTKDNFYTPGEGIAGATITAKRIGSGETYTTTTFGTGGYTLPVPTGTYVVSSSGAGFATTLRNPRVYVGTENIKADFRPADAGIIRGNVYNDTNRNGVQDSGETGIPNLLLHIDAHRDGRRNNSELYARTNADGAYRFLDLAPGTYRIRMTLPTGQTITSPNSGYYDVALGSGKIAGGKSFGNAPIVAIASLKTTTFGQREIQTDSDTRLVDGLV